MLRFIKGKGHQPSAERLLKLQKELSQFSKTIAHGFPHRPSALAWDPKLKLTAIGTRNGQIRVYGKPGVEFSNQHENEAAVTRIQFLENQGRLITLLDDSTLHLWQIDVKNDKSVLIEVKELELEKRLQKVSATCVRSNNEQLWLGTESGNIYTLDVLKLKVLEEKLICQDVVMHSVPDDFKVNPGAVEAISQHPADSDKILIGYNRGLIVLWDCTKMAVESTFVGNQQQLESISWSRNGKSFISAHNDGSYITWDVSDPSKPKEKPQWPHGPFPCKSITKLVLNAGEDGDDFIVFTGGMPRASYGDRHTLSIIGGEKHQVLDFTSKVVDFFTIDDDELGSPKALIALAEEEIVVIDLLSEGFPQFRLSYLSSLHSSAITCWQHCGDVPEELWNKIVEARKKQTADEQRVTFLQALSDDKNSRLETELELQNNPSSSNSSEMDSMEDILDSLIVWIKSFQVQAPHSTAFELSDGVALAQVLAQIEPKYFNSNWLVRIKKASFFNSKIKRGNLIEILSRIHRYNMESLGNEMLSLLEPNVNEIVKKQDPTEFTCLLLLVLGCAINCSNKEIYLEAIYALEVNAREVVMNAIKQLHRTDLTEVNEMIFNLIMKQGKLS